MPVDATECTGFDVRKHFGFCTLFMGHKDVRLTLNMPDMVLLTDGMPVHWLFTAKFGPLAGNVLKKNVSECVPEKIMKLWHVSIPFPELPACFPLTTHRLVSTHPHTHCDNPHTHGHMCSHACTQKSHTKTHTTWAYTGRKISPDNHTCTHADTCNAQPQQL